MIEYSNAGLEAIHAEAIVIEVDCLGDVSQRTLQPCDPSLMDIVHGYRQAFEFGEIEPGQVKQIDRGTGVPKHVYLLPTRVHPRGQWRNEWIAPGCAIIIDHLLRTGIKSLAVLAWHDEKGTGVAPFKLPLLHAFSRVPDIEIVWLSPQKSIKKVTIFSDGGVAQGHGAGGYGVVMRFGDTTKELSEGFLKTSVPRMELMAAIAGLEALKHSCRVRLYSDSRYLIDAVNQGWLFRLAANHWKKTRTQNIDLWKRFLDAYLRHEVEMVWVKGHAGIADNERCDELATLAMRKSDLQTDSGFHPAKRSRANKTKKTKAVELVGATKAMKIGDPCRHCQQPLVRRDANSSVQPAPTYAWYLYCESCHKKYIVEEAKVARKKTNP